MTGNFCSDRKAGVYVSILLLCCVVLLQGVCSARGNAVTSGRRDGLKNVEKIVSHENRSEGIKSDDVPIDDRRDNNGSNDVRSRINTYRELNPRYGSWNDPNVDIFESEVLAKPVHESLQFRTAKIWGIRVEKSPKPVDYEEDGVSVVLADSDTKVRLFGANFSSTTLIRFTTQMATAGTDCDDFGSTKAFQIIDTQLTNHSAVAYVQLPPFDGGEKLYYICVRDSLVDMPWIHMGIDEWILLKSYQKWIPLWGQIALICVLLVGSGLFSGLNLGLMAIDRTELKILSNTGSDKEKSYAKKIQPVRDNGNYLLCSLLLGNVLVNTVLTILMDDLTSGLIAIVASTLGIVIFGEIIPQAICSRYGLAVGAQTLILTKFLMVITFPLSYPISLILDKVLGEEIGNVYNRDRLKELIKVTHGYNDLENDEMQIIAGALDLKQKTVGDVMTKLEEVFMLSVDAVLDFQTVSDIMNEGYSRIPVFENEKSNVVALLHVKDLAFVDPDDKMPLKTICQFYSNPYYSVLDTQTLDVAFKDFKKGNKGHMAIVKRFHSSDSGDPYYEVVGVVTLEDVIEALIQSEIEDETDVWDRRKSSKKVAEQFTTQIRTDSINLSPQLKLAAFQYLSTSIEQFSSNHVSPTILDRLLAQNLYREIRVKNKEKAKQDPETIIYERGKPADYFVLILDGRVQAEMGKEKLVFESGAFTYFGTQCLNGNDAQLTPTPGRRSTSNIAGPVNLDSIMHSSFIPDYSVRAVTDVTYLCLSRSIYMAVKQATLLERTYTYPNGEAPPIEKDPANMMLEITEVPTSKNSTSDSQNESSKKTCKSSDTEPYAFENQGYVGEPEFKEVSTDTDEDYIITPPPTNENDDSNK